MWDVESGVVKAVNKVEGFAQAVSFMQPHPNYLVLASSRKQLHMVCIQLVLVRTHHFLDFVSCFMLLMLVVVVDSD